MNDNKFDTGPIPPQDNEIAKMPADLKWEDNDEILSATVYIWGVGFHITAVEVDEAGEALNKSAGARELETIRSFYDGETVPFRTVELRPGRWFVPFLVPGQDLSRAKADCISFKLLEAFKSSGAKSIEEFATIENFAATANKPTVQEGMTAFHRLCEEGFLVPGSIDPDGEIRWRMADDVKAFALSGHIDLSSPDALDRLRALRKLRSQN